MVEPEPEDTAWDLPPLPGFDRLPPPPDQPTEDDIDVDDPLAPDPDAPGLPFVEEKDDGA